MHVSSNEWRRLAKATLVAPLIPVGLLVLVSLFGNPLEGLWASLFILPISYAVAIVIGVPLYLVFRGLSFNYFFACVLSGLICSIGISLFFMWASLTQAVVGGTWGPFLAFLSLSIIIGGLASLVFWRLVRSP